MFGSKHKREERRRLSDAEADRLESLPMPDLAALVMAAGWGPDGRGRPGGQRGRMQLVGALSTAKLDVEGYKRVESLCLEGLNALERAGLVIPDTREDNVTWGPTRAGLQALEQDQVHDLVRALGPS